MGKLRIILKGKKLTINKRNHWKNLLQKNLFFFRKSCDHIFLNKIVSQSLINSLKEKYTSCNDIYENNSNLQKHKILNWILNMSRIYLIQQPIAMARILYADTKRYLSLCSW